MHSSKSANNIVADRWIRKPQLNELCDNLGAIRPFSAAEWRTVG